MANKKYEETDIQAIATAIKEKTGSEEPLYVRDMASGVNEVYEAGSANFIKMFFAEKVASTYRFKFAGADLSGFTFNPTLKPTTVGYAFQQYGGAELPKGIDFSEAQYDFTTDNDYIIPVAVFQGSTYLKEIYDMNIRPGMRMTNFVRECPSLTKIEMIYSDERTTYVNSFHNCPSLVYVRFSGVIGQNISFSRSPLDIDSLKNITKHLKDYAPGDEANHFKYTLTVKASAWDALVESGFTDDDYSWILSTIGLDSDSIEALGYTWTEIVGALCWNLTLAS